MRFLFGIGTIVGAILLFCFGLYLGVWVMLVGGVESIVAELSGDGPVNALAVAKGVACVLFCELPIVICTWSSMVIGGIGGFTMLKHH